MSPALTELIDRLVPASPDRARDLGTAAVAAVAGGVAAMAHYRNESLEVRDKGRDDPVTAADHAANRAILAVLADRAPGDPVRSEEGRGDLRPMARPPARLWIVDPLDGTKEFLARNGEFAVMVGLAEGGRAVLGAVYEPDPDRLHLGVSDRAAWTVARPRHRPTAERLEPGSDGRGRLRLVASRSHGDPALDRLAAELGVVEVVRSGSVGIKCALVAAGEADLYVHPVPHLKEWDTCAPEAVLRGAGGRVTDCGGAPLEYGKRDPRQPRGIFAGRVDAWRRARRAVETAAAALLEGEAAG